MIHSNILDFEIIETGNPKTLVFVDSSDYFEEPERPLLNIILPGFKKYFTANIVAKKVNTLNSNTIGITNVLDTGCLQNLPDGVWTLIYRICPYEKVYIQKYYLRTTKLQEKFDDLHDLIKRADCCDCEKLKKVIVDVMLLIETGKAAARKGNAKRASDFYQKANTRIMRSMEKFKTC